MQLRGRNRAQEMIKKSADKKKWEGGGAKCINEGCISMWFYYGTSLKKLS